MRVVDRRRVTELRGSAVLQAFFLERKKLNCIKQTGQARFPVFFKTRLLEILLSAELVYAI